MNPPRRSADYTLYKRHGLWPIAHASGWSAEIITNTHATDDITHGLGLLCARLISELLAKARYTSIKKQVRPLQTLFETIEMCAW